METFLVSTLLIVFGLVAAFYGYLVFRILLPILGLIVGFAIGFGGVQAIFDSGVWSTTVAIISGIIVALITAALSYFYYTIGAIILGAAIGAGAMGFLANAFGLAEDGLVTLLMSLSGAIIAGYFVFKYGLQRDLIVWLSAFAGVAFVFTGLFLAVGDLTLNELHETRVLTAFRETIDQSFFWFIAWFGGALMAGIIQRRLTDFSFMDDAYVIDENLDNSY